MQDKSHAKLDLDEWHGLVFIIDDEEGCLSSITPKRRGAIALTEIFLIERGWCQCSPSDEVTASEKLETIMRNGASTIETSAAPEDSNWLKFLGIGDSLSM